MSDGSSRYGHRSKIVSGLAHLLLVMRLAHPIRVAVDGRTAAGKTTFANELAAELSRGGRPVIRTSIDGFHKPRRERYARGRFSPEGYYHDARDLAAVRRLLLEPLGENGDRNYRTESFDLEADRPIDAASIEAPPDAVVIVDGTFLQRPELRDCWDLAIFLQTSAFVAERRGIGRDTIGIDTDLALVRRAYAERYVPAYAIYDRECRPSSFADVVIDNEDFEFLTMTVRPDGRLRESCGSTEDILLSE